MKKFNRYSKIMALVVAMTATMFACVEDDYDKPDIPQIPIGDVYTIQQVKDFFYNNDNSTYTFTEDASVYATVTMDEETDNSYKTIFIQDNTAAIAIFQNVSGGVYIGDSVRVYLKDLVVMQYQNLFQINSVAGDGVNVDGVIIKQGYNNKRVPEIATIAQIAADMNFYQGRVVKIKDVQFVDTDTAKTFANAADLETEERLIQDVDGNLLIVRTSGYATFADADVPNGNGSIIAVVGQYGTTIQLGIRRLSEVDMEATRFDGSTGSGVGSFDDPLDVASAVSINTGDNVWVEGYIVGVYETVDDMGATLLEFTPSFTAPFYTDANIIIADSETETNINNCLIVQLTSGEIRNTLNLVDNVSNQAKQVMVYGDLTAYFGDEGLKNTSGYWFEGDGINPDDPIDVVVIGTSTTVSTLDENFTGVTPEVDFASSGWLGANVKGERYWQGKEYESNGYIQATGYGATASELESWVVTPGIDCSVNKQLSFGTKVGYWKHSGLSVLISSDFDGNSTNLISSTWTDITSQCTIPTTPTDGYGADYTSSVVDLSSYTGETIYVLFKYIGDNSDNTTTYQIDNVQVTDL